MSNDERSRRGFLQWTTALIGASIGAVLAVPVFRYLTFPVRPRGKEGVVSTKAELIPVAKAVAVKEGRPLRVEVHAKSKRDAWSKTEHVPLGAAWLVRQSNNEIVAFNTVCPHKGCAIDFAADHGKFTCPCHTSLFALDGKREAGPSPRGMDPLRVEIKADQVFLNYETFVIGTSERKKA